MHALAVDQDGNEVLCALSIAETLEYLTLAKQDFHGDAALRTRYLELYDKHEDVRKRLLIAVDTARKSGKVN